MHFSSRSRTRSDRREQPIELCADRVDDDLRKRERPRQLTIEIRRVATPARRSDIEALVAGDQIGDGPAQKQRTRAYGRRALIPRRRTRLFLVRRRVIGNRLPRRRRRYFVNEDVDGLDRRVGSRGKFDRDQGLPGCDRATFAIERERQQYLSPLHSRVVQVAAQRWVVAIREERVHPGEHGSELSLAIVPVLLVEACVLVCKRLREPPQPIAVG